MGLQLFGLQQPSVPGCSAFPCAQDADCGSGCTTCMPQGRCQAPYNPDIDSRDAVDYAWAGIPIQPLPDAGDAILASIAAHAPGTSTPTAPALQGAIDHATAWQKAHPGRLRVVAFATDELPSERDLDPAHLAAIATAGYVGAPSIKTFVIGVGPALQELDAIAAAGGRRPRSTSTSTSTSIRPPPICSSARSTPSAAPRSRAPTSSRRRLRGRPSTSTSSTSRTRPVGAPRSRSRSPASPTRRTVRPAARPGTTMAARSRRRSCSAARPARRSRRTSWRRSTSSSAAPRS